MDGAAAVSFPLFLFEFSQHFSAYFSSFPLVLQCFREIFLLRFLFHEIEKMLAFSYMTIFTIFTTFSIFTKSTLEHGSLSPTLQHIVHTGAQQHDRPLPRSLTAEQSNNPIAFETNWLTA